jgi:HAD superfamily hydrolase (TIGR01509 family)
VLTNNNFLVKRHFSTLYPEITSYVGDRAYVSAEFGTRKPNPEVYRRCLTRLGIAPEATLFIDDSQANVDGAHQAGLRGCRYTAPDGLSVVLRTQRVLA